MPKFSCFLDNAEYQKLRNASMRGLLSGASKLERDSNGNVTFHTKAPKKLANQLENIIDFGATSAYDILDIPATYRYS